MTTDFYLLLLTIPLLQRATDSTAQRASFWLYHIVTACEVFQINTFARLSAFLAQIAHETARLKYSKEIWGPTPAQRRYEGRLDLGNVQPGDGSRYRGRGLIQTTGRANYRALRDGLRTRMEGVPDFEAEPELLEQPKWAALSAAWFWHSKKLNALADQGTADAFVAITRKVNGGTNGLADRKLLWDAARDALPLAAPPAAPALDAPAQDSAMQSGNYSASKSGWDIAADGGSEFVDIPASRAAPLPWWKALANTLLKAFQ